ncbi:NAD(P)/FAD-dependent oxidoreductase [Myxococcaceae bacterium GXIMD 01537]
MERQPAGAAKEPHVVIIGGGFGGLNAAKALHGARVRITLVDRTNHHLFQPLLYQVATASLSPSDIAVPIRSVFTQQRNVRVLMAEARGVDLQGQRVLLDEGALDYDYLVLAAGAANSYFGNDAWAEHAWGLKDLRDALSIRERMLRALEAAEREPDEAVRRRLLTFVVIGGGPTGVEMAGAFAELARKVLARDFRAIDPASARVVLVEAGPRVLRAFPESLGQSARQQLESLGVTVWEQHRVKDIDAQGVLLADGTRLASANVIWAAGVKAEPLAHTLGVELDRAGRVKVGEDCSVPGHSRVFVIGDMAAMTDCNGVEVPGLCPAAIQQGEFVARCIREDLAQKPRGRFAYRDKGTMATIGRSRAIAQAGRLNLTGTLAWLAWMLVHILFLIGFRNRFVVLFEWMWQYLTFKRGARLITGHVRPVATPAPAPAEAPPALVSQGRG